MFVWVEIVPEGVAVGLDEGIGVGIVLGKLEGIALGLVGVAEFNKNKNHWKIVLDFIVVNLPYM